MSKSRNRPILKTIVLSGIFVIAALAAGLGGGYLQHVVLDAPDRVPLAENIRIKGEVSIRDLDLSRAEVVRLNSCIRSHRGIFDSVDIYLDSVEDARVFDKSSLFSWAMVLDAGEDREVRSWVRKVERGRLVAHVVSYMNKAADEYRRFRDFRDARRDFRCIYI